MQIQTLSPENTIEWDRVARPRPGLEPRYTPEAPVGEFMMMIYDEPTNEETSFQLPSLAFFSASEKKYFLVHEVCVIPGSHIIFP